MMYGEVFRNFRKKKGYNINQLSDEYVSRSAISRFEREETDISFSKLLHLLKKINVTFEEFGYMISSQELSSRNNISQIILNNDLKKLKQLIKNMSLKESILIQDRLNIVVLKNQYNQINKEENYEINHDFVVDYLFVCEQWTYYEVVLFANTINLFEVETIELLTKELISKIEYFTNQRHYYETVINTIENAIFILIERNEIVKSSYFLKILKDLNLDETFVLENNILIYLEGVLKVLSKEPTGVEMIKESLQVFEIVNAKGFTNMLKTFLVSINIKLY